MKLFPIVLIGGAIILVFVFMSDNDDKEFIEDCLEDNTAFMIYDNDFPSPWICAHYDELTDKEPCLSTGGDWIEKAAKDADK